MEAQELFPSLGKKKMMMSMLLLASILSSYKFKKKIQKMLIWHFEHLEVMCMPKAYIFKLTLFWHVFVIKISSKRKISLFIHRSCFLAENINCT